MINAQIRMLIANHVREFCNTVEPPFATTSPQRPLFQDTKSFQVELL